MNEQNTDLVMNQNSHLYENVIELAFDCERLRTMLSEWLREVMIMLQVDGKNISHVQSIKQSNFGLWVKHKAPFYWNDRDEVETLIILLDSIDAIVEALKNNQDSLDIIDILKCLNDSVTHAIWLLGDLAKEIMEENNHDGAYSHRLNCDYLETVLAYETELSVDNDMVYAVIHAEVDQLSSLNKGELNQIRDALTRTVSSGDFVFQSKDNQFCLILVDIDKKIAEKVAEKLRAKIDIDLDATLSLGLAFHDGESESYQQVIESSQQALAKAKANKGNQLVIQG